MKTIMSTLCVLALIFMVTPMAFATGSTQAGVTVTIAVTDAGLEDDFEYDVSFNVAIEIVAAQAAYAISTANTLLGTDNESGMEYGTLSTSTGYAQRKKTTAIGVGPAAPSDEVTLDATSTWIWMGGDGGS